MKRSPSVARLLDIDWNDTGWPNSDADEYGKTALPLKALLSDSKNTRPAVVLFFDPSVDKETAKEIEKQMFGDDKLVAATRFFSCFRIAIGDVPENEFKKKYLKRTPALIFMGSDGQVVGEISGKRAQPRTITSRLSKVFKDSYKGSLKRQIGVFMDYLGKLEKIEDNVDVVKVKVKMLKDQLGRRETARKKKKLVEAEAELVKATEELKAFKDRRDAEIMPVSKHASKDTIAKAR